MDNKLKLHFAGSADKTVKFWDLESFEMIGSARCEVFNVSDFYVLLLRRTSSLQL